MQRQGLVCGIFSSLQGALSLQSSRGGIFSKGCHFFPELHSLQLFLRYHTQKNYDDGGAQVGNAYLAYMVVTPLVLGSPNLVTFLTIHCAADDVLLKKHFQEKHFQAAPGLVFGGHVRAFLTPNIHNCIKADVLSKMHIKIVPTWYL